MSYNAPMTKQTKKSSKKIQVVERKLGRQRAVGQAWREDNIIDIDPRQTSKEYFLTLIHERVHLLYPSWSEKEVIELEKGLGEFLWKHKVRIIK